MRDIEDMIRELHSTDTEPDELELEVGPRGEVVLLTPEGSDIDADSEDADAFEALLEDTSPGEASRLIETMRPLSDDEASILEEVPLEGLTRVDDTENDEWMFDLSKQGHQAMDQVLRDTSYGDDMPKTNEEMMELHGADVGWGIPGLSSLKKVARGAYRGVKRGVKGVSRGVRGVGRGARWVGRKATRGLMQFVPRRDAGKARLVKGLYGKMVPQHANWLAAQDKRARRPLKSRASYLSASRSWAKQKLSQNGLPTKFAVSGADVLGAELIGSDVLGAWWNPLSWFVTKVKVVDQSTQNERMANPDEYPTDYSQDFGDQPYPQEAYPQEAYPQEAYPQEAYPQDAYPQDAYGYPGAPDYGETDYAYGDAMAGDGVVESDDSLMGFADEVLSGISATPPAKVKPATKEDELVQVAVTKIKSGASFSPGEVGVLATLAKRGHPGAKKVYALLLAKGKPDVTMGYWKAWAHKLNPLYWILKSSQERKLIDKEKNAWKDNAERQKDLRERREVLAQAERTKKAQEAVSAAKTQASATEAQLKAIESSITGHLVPGEEASSMMGDVLGHEKPTIVTAVIRKALSKAGLTSPANAVWEKVSTGKPLTKDELATASKVAKVLGRVKVVHGDLWEKTPAELAMMHGAFVGACVLGEVRAAAEKNAKIATVASALAKKSAPDPKALRAVAQGTRQVQSVVRKHLRHGALSGVSGGAKVTRVAQARAAQATRTQAERKMIEAIQKLANAGNPRAQKSLAMLRKSGQVVGGDFVGFSITKAFKYATAPVWLPIKGAVKATKWAGRKLGITSRRKSAQEIRLAKMRAAAKRRAAAEARARAADAQTQAELRAQESIARAADAEADAADAEALSKEAAMRTAEYEADPSSLEEAQDDSSGDFVGAWEPFVGKSAKKLVRAASSKTPAGTKIRSGASFYKKIKRGDPKARAALKTMITKAQRGDRQAKRDLKSVWAGREALRARDKAAKRRARILARKARKLKVIAAQRRLEAKLANKLVRAEKRHELRKLAKIERKAAAGSKRARAYVKKQAALAKRGDKKAKVRLEKMRLAKKVRLATPTRRERRNVVVASRLLSKARRGNPKAVRRIRVIEAAAKQGNPNAKRAVRRLKLAAALAGATAVAATAVSKKGPSKKASAVTAVATARARLATGTASREELTAGARAAHNLGDERTAGKLARAASQTPSATETLRKTAAVVAAKQAGDAEAREVIKSNFEAAKSGDPEAIAKTGKVLAVQTLQDVKEGRPVPPAMRDAINLNERVAAGDPAAAAEVKRIAEAATTSSPIPEATGAAVALSAAAYTAKALASKPQAKKELVERANAVSPEDKPAAEAKLDELAKKAEDGTITPTEGLAGIKLAERLGKPKVAAEIAAKAPPFTDDTPLSSLPDMALAPVTGVRSLVKESLRAITLSTRDPLANWRGGLQSMSRVPPAVTTSGWSPFDFFRSNPVVTILQKAADLARGSKKKSPQEKPPVVAKAAPSKAAPPKKGKAEDEAVTTAGAERTFKDYVADAIQAKKITKRDLQRAIELRVGPSASPAVKKAVTSTVVNFLTLKNVKVVS